MAVPATLVAEMVAFNKSIGLAQPLASATTILASVLKRQGSELLSHIDVALPAAAGSLDAGDPVEFPGLLSQYLLALSMASDDQTTISDIRGLVGRAALNLAQAGV